MNTRTGTSRRDDEIDEQLKKAFANLTDEALPDRFSKLLDDLRASEQAAAKPAGGEGQS